jgi:hypothetical protein
MDNDVAVNIIKLSVHTSKRYHKQHHARQAHSYVHSSGRCSRGKSGRYVEASLRAGGAWAWNQYDTSTEDLFELSPGAFGA